MSKRKLNAITLMRAHEPVHEPPGVRNQVVVSPPNAAIKVTEIILTEDARRGLTAGVPKLGDVR